MLSTSKTEKRMLLVMVMLIVMLMVIGMVMVLLLLLRRRGCAKCLIHKVFSHKRGLPKSTHAPTAESAWSQPARAFGLKTLQKKSAKEKGLRAHDAHFWRFMAIWASRRIVWSDIWHLTYKSTVSHSAYMVKLWNYEEVNLCNLWPRKGHLHAHVHQYICISGNFTSKPM